MTMTEKIFFAYIIFINVLAFILFGRDKRKAVKHQWRISEACLLSVAALGGSLGAWAGMQFFRHKTRHRKFSLGVPLLILLQAAGIGIFFFISRN